MQCVAVWWTNMPGLVVWAQPISDTGIARLPCILLQRVAACCSALQSLKVLHICPVFWLTSQALLFDKRAYAGITYFELSILRDPHVPPGGGLDGAYAGRRHVWRDSFTCKYRIDSSHTYVWVMSRVCMSHGWYVCRSLPFVREPFHVTWLILAWHGVFMRVTWLMYMCDMACMGVAAMCVTCLIRIYTCIAAIHVTCLIDMYTNVAAVCVTWPIHINTCVAALCVTRLIRKKKSVTSVRVTWLIYINPCVVAVCVPWLIRIKTASLLYVWRDSFRKNESLPYVRRDSFM